MLFCYYDLPMVKSISDDEKSEHPNGYDHSVNASDTITEDLISSSAIIDGEKQKLVNINAVGLHKRPRKASIMDKWHLARGRRGTCH